MSLSPELLLSSSLGLSLVLSSLSVESSDPFDESFPFPPFELSSVGISIGLSPSAAVSANQSTSTIISNS